MPFFNQPHAWRYVAFFASASAVLSVLIPAGLLQLSRQSVNATQPSPVQVSASASPRSSEMITDWLQMKPQTSQTSTLDELSQAAQLINQGSKQLEAGEFAAAQTTFDRAIALQPNNAFGYHGRALAHLRLQAYRAAIADLTKVLELRPGDVRAYANRGSAYHALGDYQAAITDYNRAIGTQPNYAVAYANRGKLHTEQQDYERALADFDRAIHLNPDDPRTFYNRAIVLANLQKPDAAIADLETAEALFRQENNFAASTLSLKILDQLKQGTFDPKVPLS